MNGDLVVSVVSHGQGALLRDLLDDLSLLDFSGFSSISIVITINVPEDESFLDGVGPEIFVIRNVRPKGFGANHNQAYSMVRSDFFLVLNPDIRLECFSLSDLLSVEDARWGAVAPLVVSPKGKVEDSARRYPTFLRMILRVIFRVKSLDYGDDGSIRSPLKVDWVGGMFIFFRSEAFAKVCGFDDRYFMYLEDADICKRINGVGFRIILNSRQKVIHDARRSSFKDLRHFKWHCRSMVRFLMGF